MRCLFSKVYIGKIWERMSCQISTSKKIMMMIMMFNKCLICIYFEETAQPDDAGRRSSNFVAHAMSS